jgi:hypothetical protein
MRLALIDVNQLLASLVKDVKQPVRKVVKQIVKAEFVDALMHV